MMFSTALVVAAQLGALVGHHRSMTSGFRFRPGLSVAALGVLVSLLLSACTGSGEAGESESPGLTPFPTPTPFPTSTPTPTPTGFPSFPPAPAGEDQTTAAIRAGFEAYWQAYDAALKDPLNDELAEAAQQVTEPGSEAAELMRGDIQYSREHDGRVIGDRTFRDITIAAPDASENGARTAIVTYCVDSSETSLVSITTGESLGITPLATVREILTLAEGTDGVWRVAVRRNEVVTC